MKTRLVFPTEAVISPSMHGKDIVLRGDVSGHVFLSQSLPAGFTCRVTQSGDGVGILTPMGNGTVNGTNGMLATTKGNPVTLVVQSNGGSAPAILAYGTLSKEEILHMNHHQRAFPGWTAANGAATTNAQSVFGGGSVFLDGVDDYLRRANNPSLEITSNFTIDFWARLTSGTTCMFFTNYRDANNYYTIFYYIAPPSYLRFRYVVSGADIVGSSGTGLSSAVTLSTGTWYHIAVVGSAGTVYLFLNGSLLNSASSGARQNIGGVHLIGAYRESGAMFPVPGYIDELRVTDTALWTSGFTPPSGES